jgi:hypothetical protein
MVGKKAVLCSVHVTCLAFRGLRDFPDHGRSLVLDAIDA